MNKKCSIGIVLAVVLALLCGFFGYRNYKLAQRLPSTVSESYNDTTGLYKKIYESREFVALQTENKALYDSLKQYREQIDYMVQFTYSKSYSTDTVWITKTKTKTKVEKVPVPVTVAQTQTRVDTVYQNVDEDETIKTYEYAGTDRDTINYRLQIGSTREPDWYKLDMSLTDQITIVNKTENGMNETDIQTGKIGVISDVTTFHKSDKVSFWKRFTVGPTVTAGYDVINKKVGVTVGVGVTFNLLK